MAYQTIPGPSGLWIPVPFASSVSAPAFFPGAILIDASGEKAAFMFHVPQTGTLDKAELHLYNVTLNGASALRISFQDVNLATGFPDGTQDQFRNITGISDGWIAPGLMTSDGTDGGTKRSVTRGDLLAIVLEYQTFTAGDSVQWAALYSGSPSAPFNIFPAAALFTASWASYGNFPCVCLKYSDGSYVGIADCCIPVSALNTNTYNSGSTPDERALYFQFPAKVKVMGAWVRCDIDGDADVVLYDSDGSSVLASRSFDKDVRMYTAGSNLFCPFSADVELAASTNYRLSLKPTTTTSVTMYDFDVASAAILDAYPGGQNWHSSTRTDAGSWTQVTTKRPHMGLIVRAIDDGVGGGGGKFIGAGGGLIG